jgi:acetyl esterase/lipase
MGFSAGGHLACSLGVHWNDPEIAARCGVTDARLLRPNGMILCYPVISMVDGVTHAGTKRNVMAHTTESQDYWSLETQVNGDTPPTFLWHTMTDASVPVENSLGLIAALSRNGVHCEAHLFPEGPHGMSLCSWEVGTPDRHVAQWLPLSCNWLNRYYF